MIVQVILTLVIELELNASPSVWINCLVAKTLDATLASYATK
jgi:hypothetical protein